MSTEPEIIKETLKEQINEFCLDMKNNQKVIFPVQDKELKEIFQTLALEQVEMPPEFAKVLNDNFWDLL